MSRGLQRFAALAVAAVASAVLVGASAQAGEPSNQGGRPGKPGSATSCRIVPQQDNASQVQCTATPGRPGAPGKAVDY
jgi:hypothetical protein